MKRLKHQLNPIKLTVFIMVLGMGFMACQTNDKKSADQNSSFTKHASIDDGEDSILVGRHYRKELEIAPYKQWFDANYQEYKVDTTVITELEPLLDGVTVKVFMGTWCSDSQHNVPAFFKIMDQAGYHYKDFELYSMTEDKKTPENYEAELDIQQVPTFIIYKDGKEVNRMVEYPLASVEKDLLDILQNKGYKNPYAL